MIGAQTVYTEAGGSFKTTTVANLAVAWNRMGFDVLAVDLDPQDANLSLLFDVNEVQEDPQADNLVEHMLGYPKGEFEDLIKTSQEGVDVIPAHDELSNFTRRLVRQQDVKKEMIDESVQKNPPENVSSWTAEGGWSNIPNREEYMFELFWNKHNLQEKYDVILIDPNARATDMLYNAMFATRTMITPFEPTGKGSLSIDGIKNIIGEMENALDIEIGITAAVPMGVTNMNIHEMYVEELKQDQAVPVAIGERSAMMDMMWDANRSVFRLTEGRYKFMEDGPKKHGRHRPRNHNVETVLKIYDLAHHIVSNIYGASVPDPQLRLEIDDKDTYVFEPTQEFPREDEYPEKSDIKVTEA